MSADAPDPVSSSPIRAEALVDSAGEDELLRTPEKPAHGGVAGAAPSARLPMTPERSAPVGVTGVASLQPPAAPTPELPPDSTTSDSLTIEVNGTSGDAPERPTPGDDLQPNSLSSAELTSTSAAAPEAPSPSAPCTEPLSSTIPVPNIPEPVIKAPVNGVPKPGKRPNRGLQGNLDQIVRKLSGVADPTRTANGHAENKTEPQERPTPANGASERLTPENGAFDAPKSALDLTTGRRDDDDDAQFKAVKWGIMKKKGDVVREPRKKAPSKTSPSPSPSPQQAPAPDNFAAPPPPLQLLRIPQYVPQSQQDTKFRSEIRLSGLAGGATVVTHAQNHPSPEEKKLYDKRFEVRPALVNPFPGGEASSSRGPFPGAQRPFPGVAKGSEVDVDLSRAYDLSGVVNGTPQPWNPQKNLVDPDMEEKRLQAPAGKKVSRRLGQTGVAEFHKALASAFAASGSIGAASRPAPGAMCATSGAMCAAPALPMLPPPGLSLSLRPPLPSSRLRGAARRKRGALKNMLVQMVGQGPPGPQMSTGGTQTEVPVLHQLLGSKSQAPDSFSVANMLGGSGGAVSVTAVDASRSGPVTDPSVVDRLKRLGTVIEVEEDPNPPADKEPPAGAPSALKMLEKMTMDPPQSPVVSALDDRPLFLGKDISVYAKKKGTSFIHPSPNAPLSIIPVGGPMAPPVLPTPPPVMSVPPPVTVEPKAMPQTKAQSLAKTSHNKVPPQLPQTLPQPQQTVPHLPLLTITKAASKPLQTALEPNQVTSQSVPPPIVTVTKTTSTSMTVNLGSKLDKEICPIEEPTETPTATESVSDYVPFPFLEPVIVLDEEESPLSSEGTYIFRHDNSHSVELPNDQKVFSCDICSAAFHHLHMLRKHYFRLHVARKYISEKDLEAYNIDPEKADDCNDENIYRCHTCRQCLPTKAELKSHLTDHPPVADLNKHIKGAKDYRCERCNAHFKWRKMFGKHKKSCRAPVTAKPVESAEVPEKEVSLKVPEELISDESPSKEEPITAVTELALRQVIDTRAVRNLQRSAKALRQPKPKRKTRRTVAMAIHSPPEVPQVDKDDVSEVIERQETQSDPPAEIPIATEEQNDKTESNPTPADSSAEPLVPEETTLPKVPKTSPVEEAETESNASLNESSMTPPKAEIVQSDVIKELPSEQVETSGNEQSEISQGFIQETKEVVTNEEVSTEVASSINVEPSISAEASDPVEVEKKSEDSDETSESVSVVNEVVDEDTVPQTGDIAEVTEHPIMEAGESVPESVDSTVVESSTVAKNESTVANTPALPPTVPEKVDLKGLHPCLYCNETFNNGNKKRNHTLSQHPYVRKNHPCVFCKSNPNSFKTNVELFQHLLTAHPTLYFACQSCKERFYNLDDLRDHLSKRHTLDSSELKELNDRKSEVSGEAPIFTCAACQRIWLFKSCFVDHKCNPEKEKPTNPDKVTRLPKLRKVKTMDRSDPETMFYSQVTFNVRNNLLHFLDGKLPQDDDDEEVEDESASKAPERNMLSFSDGIEGSGLQLIPEPEPYSRVKAQWEKYNFPKNYDGRCGLTSYIKDMSYLDISTQLIMRRNLQRLQGDPEVTPPTTADDVPSNLALERLATQCAESFGINGIPGGDGETTLGELSGEWVRDRLYICSVCGWETPCLWTMEDHKYEVHPQVLCPQHELVGEQRSLANTIYKRVFPVEEGLLTPEKPHLRSLLVTKVPCTKCGMDGFNSRPELHVHVLACAGEPIPHWAPTPRKKRWKKRRRPRRGLKRNIPSTPHRPIKVRTKPGDTDTIQKMIANLPAKRSTRRVIGFDEADLKTRSQSTIQNITDFQGPVLLPSSRLVLPPSQATHHKHSKPSSKGSPKTSKDLLMAPPPHVPRGTDLIDTSAERGDVLSSLRMMPVSTPREELLEPRQIIDKVINQKVLGVQSEETSGHPCTGCGQTSESKNALRKHQKACAYFRECGPNAEHKCKACYRLFDNLVALIEHSCDEMPKLEIEKDLSPVNSAEIPVLSPVQHDGKKGYSESANPNQICGVSFVNGKISYETVDSIRMADEGETNLKRKRSHSLGDIPSGKKMFRTGHRRSARLGQAESGPIETPEDTVKSEVPLENAAHVTDEDMYESAPEARLASGKNKTKKLPTRAERSKNDTTKKPDINRQVLEIKAMEQSMSRAAQSPSVESESFLDDDSLWEKQAVVAISEDETTKLDVLEQKPLAGDSTTNKAVVELDDGNSKSGENENKPKFKRRRVRNLRFATKKGSYKRGAKGKLPGKISLDNNENAKPYYAESVEVDEAQVDTEGEGVIEDVADEGKIEDEIKNEDSDFEDLDSSKAEVAVPESAEAAKKKTKSVKKGSPKVLIASTSVTDTPADEGAPQDVPGKSTEKAKKTKKVKGVVNSKIVVRLKSKGGKQGVKGKGLKVKLPKKPNYQVPGDKKKQRDLLSFLNRTPPSVKKNVDDLMGKQGEPKTGNDGEDHISMSIDAVASGTAEALIAIMKTNNLSGLLDLPDGEMDQILDHNQSSVNQINGTRVTSQGIVDNKTPTITRKKEGKAKKKGGKAKKKEGKAKNKVGKAKQKVVKAKMKKTSVALAEGAEKSHVVLSSEVVAPTDEAEKSLTLNHNQSSVNQISETGVTSQGIVDYKNVTVTKKKEGKAKKKKASVPVAGAAEKSDVALSSELVAPTEEAEKSLTLGHNHMNETGETSESIVDDKKPSFTKKEEGKAKKKKKASVPVAEAAEKSHVALSSELVAPTEEADNSFTLDHNQSSVNQIIETVVTSQGIVDDKSLTFTKKEEGKAKKKKASVPVAETAEKSHVALSSEVFAPTEEAETLDYNQSSVDQISETGVTSQGIVDNTNVAVAKKKEGKAKKKKASVPVAEAAEQSHVAISSELVAPTAEAKKSLTLGHKQSSDTKISETGVTSQGIVDDKNSTFTKKKEGNAKKKKVSVPVAEAAEHVPLSSEVVALETKETVEVKKAPAKKDIKKQNKKKSISAVEETSNVPVYSDGGVMNDIKAEIKPASSPKKSKKQSQTVEETLVKQNEIENESVADEIAVEDKESAAECEEQIGEDMVGEHEKRGSKKKGKKGGKDVQIVKVEEKDESVEIGKPVLRRRSGKSSLMAELLEEALLGLDSDELYQEELPLRTTRSKRSSRKQDPGIGDAEKAQEGDSEISDEKEPEIVPRVTRRQYKKDVAEMIPKEITTEPKELTEIEPPAETVVANPGTVEQVAENEDEPLFKRLAPAKLKKTAQKSGKKKGSVEATIDGDEMMGSIEATIDENKKGSIDATIEDVISYYVRNTDTLSDGHTDSLPNDEAEMDNSKKPKKRPTKKVDSKVPTDEVPPSIFYPRTSVTEVESKDIEISRNADPSVDLALLVEDPKPKNQAGKRAKKSVKAVEESTESKDVNISKSEVEAVSESTKISPAAVQKIEEALDVKATAPVSRETDPGIQESSGNVQLSGKDIVDQRKCVKPADASPDLKERSSGEVTNAHQNTSQVKSSIPFKNKLLSGRLPSAEKAAALLSRKPLHQVDPLPSEEPKKRKIFSYQKKTAPARRLTRSNSNGKSDPNGEPVIDPYDYNEDEIVPFQEPRYKPYSPPKPVLYAPPPAKRRARKREDSPDTTTIVVQAEVHPEPPPRRRADVNALPDDKTSVKLTENVPMTTSDPTQSNKRKSSSPLDKGSSLVESKKPKMGTCYDGIDVLEDEDSESSPPQLVPIDEPNLVVPSAADRLNDAESQKAQKPQSSLRVTQWSKIDPPLRSASPVKKDELPSRALSSRGSTPTRVSSPMRTASSSRTASPPRMVSPARISSPARVTSPARISSPARKTSPARMASARMTSPARVASARMTSPARVASPARISSPARVSSPALVASPSRLSPMHTSLPLRSYGRVMKPMSPPSEPPELVDESKVTIEEKFDADSSSPILQPAAGPLSDLFDPEPPALERTGDLVTLTKNTPISEEDTETAVDTEEDTDSMKSCKSFKKKGKDLKLKMKKQLMRLKALKNKKKKDLKKTVGGTRKEVVKISGMAWEVSELATSPAKSEPPPPPVSVLPIIKDWDASDLWDSPIVNAVPIVAPGPVAVTGAGASGSPADPSPTHPSMPPLSSPSPAPRNKRSDSAGSTNIPSLGSIFDSVNKLLNEPENNYSSLPPQYSLADLQRAMGASDAEMAVLQQLGEASCLTDFDESLRPVVGNAHLEDEWIMDLDNQAAQQPIVSSSVVESPPSGTPPPEAAAPQSVPLASSASNSSSSSSIPNTMFQTRFFGSDLSGLLRSSSMCKSLRTSPKCGSSALLAAHGHKEVVCPTCSCHFMGFPALQIHVNKVHGSQHDPTQVTGSLQNRRVVLESNRGTSRLVCFECNQILPSHLMYRHLELDHFLEPGLVSRCSTVTGDLHQGPVVGERLKSKMSSALGDLLDKAVANMLIAKNKPEASSTPTAPGVSPNAMELLNRLCAARKRDTSRINSKDMSFNKLKLSEPVPVRTDDDRVRPLSSRPFLCTICGQRFPLAASRNKHEALAHKAFRNQNKMNLNDDDYYDDEDDDWRDAPSPESAFEDGGGSSLTPTCSDCGLSFDSVSDLVRHRVEDHAPRRQLPTASESGMEAAAPVSSSTAPAPVAPRRISSASRSQSLDTTSPLFDMAGDWDDSCSTAGTKSASGTHPASGTNSSLGTDSPIGTNSPVGTNSSPPVDPTTQVDTPVPPKKSRPRSGKVNSGQVSKIKAEAALRQLSAPR